MHSYQAATFRNLVLLVIVVVGAIVGTPGLATDTGSVSGTVLDPSGAVVPGAAVTLRGSDGNQRTTSSGEDGSFLFDVIAPGHYAIQVDAQGFKSYHEHDIDVDAGTVFRADAQLTLASQSQVVEVTSDPTQIDPVSTQTGGLISSKTMTSVPLNGRSFTDLLAMQPGVIPASSAQSNAVVMSGCTATPPSGDLNAGNLSVSGQRETANGFLVNGSVVEEDFNNGTAVVPTLDAIQDLRVLTNNFDAEYGNYSGGQVVVTTKSGSNQLHGNIFEFLRNTDLDARNYFAPTRAAYNRNEYGGTLGGPIRKNKAYFFVDYQGTQMKQGQETGNIVVPSVADRTGNLSDLASQLTGKVSTQYWADQLSQKLGYSVSASEPYYVAGCTSSAQCVFPYAKIPSAAWSAPAKSLLQYIPVPNVSNNLFSNSSENESLERMCVG